MKKANSVNLTTRSDQPSTARCQWHPIATAPKDGTAILLCWAIDADGNPIDWTQDPTTAGVFVQAASWWEGDGEWVVYCSMVRDPALHFIPTHWMPLPAPPASSTPAGDEKPNQSLPVPASEASDSELREQAKIAWRALCDAEAVIRTISGESTEESEGLAELRERLTDCAMHLFTVLREPTQEWARAQRTK